MASPCRKEKGQGTRGGKLENKQSELTTSFPGPCTLVVHLQEVGPEVVTIVPSPSPYDLGGAREARAFCSLFLRLQAPRRPKTTGVSLAPTA